MPAQSSHSLERRFEFAPTEAVARSRANARFIVCPACGADAERYLFHERGARFVQCRTCDVVYANPPAREFRDYFNVAAGGGSVAEEREHVVKELGEVLRYATEVYRSRRGGSPRAALVAGRAVEDLHESFANVRSARLTRQQTVSLVNDADVSAIVDGIDEDVDLVVLNQVMEACPQASEVAAAVAAHLPERVLLVVVYSNVASLPGRVLRHYWRRFFDWKAVYFNSENLRSMFERSGLQFVAQTGLSTSYTVTRALGLAAPASGVAHTARRLGLGRVSARVPTGTYVALFEHAVAPSAPELLSVIFPVYNEVTYVGAVLDQLLEQEFIIPHEIIVVESNSTDGTREAVQAYEGTPRMRILYEDRPRGKGSAVRRGLAEVTGTIVLIQDADFEYDLDDYDALLEPIVQRRTGFVLGSRSLGLDDWKVRRYARSRVKAFLMNFAQLMFARTFNALYQQRTTDINTMFKVFRRECIEGARFDAEGFNFDIELACTLVNNGYSPMEVPVNYIGRGFDEGKKINFVTEFFPSYFMLFRRRFGRRTHR